MRGDRSNRKSDAPAIPTGLPALRCKSSRTAMNEARNARKAVPIENVPCWKRCDERKCTYNASYASVGLSRLSSRMFLVISDCYLNDSTLQFSTTDHFASGGDVMEKTMSSFTFCWSPLSPTPVS